MAFEFEAFDEFEGLSIFPDNISSGAEVEIVHNTTAIEVANGKTQRNRNWKSFQWKFTVSHNVKSKEQYDDLKNFVIAVGGAFAEFRFKNPSDFTVSRDECYLRATSNPLQFKMLKKFGNFLKEITHPTEKIEVWSEQTKLRNGLDYVVDYNKGLITLLSAKPELSFECEYDVRCRFTSDSMKSNMTHYDLFNWSMITIEEVK